MRIPEISPRLEFVFQVLLRVGLTMLCTWLFIAFLEPGHRNVGAWDPGSRLAWLAASTFITMLWSVLLEEL